VIWARVDKGMMSKRNDNCNFICVSPKIIKTIVNKNNNYKDYILEGIDLVE
jgi:hypothetical protein